MGTYRGYYNSSIAACGYREVYDPIIKGDREANSLDYFIDAGTTGINVTVGGTNDTGIVAGTRIYLEGGGSPTVFRKYNHITVEGIIGNPNALADYVVLSNWSGGWEVTVHPGESKDSGMKIWGPTKYFILDGRGDSRFQGHWLTGIIQTGKYGIRLDTGYRTGQATGSAQSMSIEVSDGTTGAPGTTNVIVESIECDRAAFGGMALKSDNYTDQTDNANMYSCKVVNCLFWRSWSEHFYFGKVDGRPSRHLNEADHAIVDLEIHNSVALYGASENVQLQRLARFTKFTNNISFAGGLGWTNPFQNNQDHNSQIIFYQGGKVGQPAVFDKNMFIGGATSLMHLRENSWTITDDKGTASTADDTVHNSYLTRTLDGDTIPPDGSGEVVMRHNIFAGTRDSIIYGVLQPEYSINYHFEDNWIRGWRQDKNLVHSVSNPTSKNTPYLFNFRNPNGANRFFTRRNKIQNDDPLGRPLADNLNYYSEGTGADADDHNAQVAWPVFMSGLSAADWYKFGRWSHNGTYFIGSGYNTANYNFGAPNNFEEGWVAIEYDDVNDEYVGAYIRKVGAGTGNERPSTNPALWDPYVLPLDFRLDPNVASNQPYIDAGVGLVWDQPSPTDTFILQTSQRIKLFF